MLVPKSLGDCWGVDGSTHLTQPQYRQLRQTDLRLYSAAARRWSPASPVFPEFRGGYCPLPGNGVGEDVTAGELAVGAQEGFVILIFVHPRAGDRVNGKDVGWMASAQLGERDAQAAIAYLDAIGYSVTYASGSVAGPVPHVIQDMENLRNPGLDAVAQATRFRDVIAGCLRLAPAIYNGFNPGLTPQQFADLGVPVCKDTGSRQSPPGRGFVYEQTELDVTIPGLGKFDIVHAHPDLTGATLVGMGWQADPSTPPPPVQS